METRVDVLKREIPAVRFFGGIVVERKVAEGELFGVSDDSCQA